MADALTGRTPRKQYRLASSQNAEQKARLAEEERKISAVEEGQRRMRGGGRGFTAFVDGMDEDSLSPTFGATASDLATLKKKKAGGFSDLAERAA